LWKVIKLDPYPKSVVSVWFLFYWHTVPLQSKLPPSHETRISSHEMRLLSCEMKDVASLVSVGAGFPMFTTFIKDVTPEIVNPRGLRMVSVNIYVANYLVFNRKHIVHNFHDVQTCTLKLLLLLTDPSGFFRQVNAAINEVINFTSVERCCIHEKRVNSVMFNSKHGPSRTVLGLRAVHNFHNCVSITDWRALLTLQLSEFCDTAYFAAFAIKNSFKAISFLKRFSLFVGFSESLLLIDVHVGEININRTNLTKRSQSFHQLLNRLWLSR